MVFSGESFSTPRFSLAIKVDVSQKREPNEDPTQMQFYSARILSALRLIFDRCFIECGPPNLAMV